MKHLLIIRNSAMGDVALTVPVIKAALATYPGLKITLLSQKNFSPFFENLPRFNFLSVDFKSEYRGFWGITRLYAKLRKAGPYDAVLDLHAVIRSWIIGAYFKAAGTPVFTIEKGRSEKKAITRKHQKIFKKLKPSYQRYADVFGRAGFPVSLGKGPWIDGGEFPSAFLEERSIFPKDKIWIGIAPFARHKWKTWPENRSAQLALELALEGYIVFLFGGGKEEASRLEHMAAQDANIHSLAGRLPLHHELALMQRLDLMVAMDSANMHLASLVGTPVVSVWGQTHSYAGFEPLGVSSGLKVEIDPAVLACRPCSVFGNRPCYRGDFACMNWIRVRDVKTKIKDALQENYKQ